MVDDAALELTWYGHAMFAAAGSGRTIVIDPVPPQVGYTYVPVPADVVVMTHGHFDHTFMDGVSGNPRTISTAGTFDVDGLAVRGYEGFHDAKGGQERGPVVIFSWEQAGLKLAHFGDLGDRPTEETMRNLKGLDIAMMPVGSVYTVDAAGALDLVSELAPSIVIPMHYGTPDCVIPLDPVEEFTGKFGGATRLIERRPLTVSRADIPDATEVWVLPYR